MDVLLFFFSFFLWWCEVELISSQFIKSSAKISKQGASQTAIRSIFTLKVFAFVQYIIRLHLHHRGYRPSVPAGVFLNQTPTISRPRRLRSATIIHVYRSISSIEQFILCETSIPPRASSAWGSRLGPPKTNGSARTPQPHLNNKAAICLNK